MSKILIIDDEEALTSLLKDSFESRGYEVLIANDGYEGMNKIKEHPDLIILDIMMPGMDGFDLCRRIRDEVLCPIIFLSAKQSEVHRVKGLAIGGDDYVVKPFSLKELTARVEAHLRREKRFATKESNDESVLLSFKNLSLDLKGKEAKIKENIVPLTKKQFDIVELLALHPGQVFSKEQIYEKIWGYDAEGDSAAVTEHIKNIRNKFSELDKENNYISTVWGIGYRWEKR